MTTTTLERVTTHTDAATDYRHSAFKPYIYQGTGRDELTPEPATNQASRPRPDCGTTAGYRYHRNHGETPCQPCRNAIAEYHRDRRTKNTPARTPAPCGTTSAAARHYKRGEKPCEPCAEAVRKAAEIQRRNNGIPKRQLQPCGTVAAYVRHLRHGEEACQPCKTAAYKNRHPERYERNQEKDAA